MQSPFERYHEYYQITDEMFEFIDKYFSGFYGTLQLILMIVLIFAFGCALIFMGLQILYKLADNKRYSDKKMQLSFILLISSALIGGGYGLVLYKYIGEMMSLEKIIEESGYEYEAEPDYIPPEDTVWE